MCLNYRMVNLKKLTTHESAHKKHANTTRKFIFQFNKI